MREELISLESDFANNEYFGTNVWTEEKYRTLSGNIPVLLSAPHSVNQIRGEDVRDAERYTGGIVRYLSNNANCYGIFQMFTHADPNFDSESMYKNGIINLINAYNIKLLIDVHSSTFTDDTDIDIVTNGRKTLLNMPSLYEKIKSLGIKYNIKVDENNIPNKDKENEIIHVASTVCGVPSLRIVINKNSIDINNDKIESIIKVIEEFISYFNYNM
ncbi:MAG: hypothetical protein IJ094_07670 [Bacilli bacterium]|nr:hypothetical protein [Bacilli bacterium]